MDYLCDERDIRFVLFEHLKIGQLAELDSLSALTSDDYTAFFNEALKFAQNEIAPLNVPSDRQECELKNGVVSTPKGFKEVYHLFAQNGFIGIDVPPTYGGMGLPMSVTIAMSEVFVGACVAFSMYPGLSRGAAHLIETFASPELAERFVPNMYSGLWAGTMCLTEPHAGSAVGDLKTSATPQSDGTYHIKGSKIFISGGDHSITDTIIHLVLARIASDPDGTKGISLFIVPKIRVMPDGALGESNDVTTVNVEHKMGIKGSATCLLSFGDNDRCIGYLVGEARKGMNYMFQMMNEARLLTGMQGMATAGTAYEHALRYAKERTQFGAPIVNYPDVRRNLMLMKSMVEGMRALLYQTALFIDLAKHHPDPQQKSYYDGLVGILTPICKAYCSDHGFKVTELAMQVFGGYGYCSDYPIEQYLRDVKIASIYEGTNGIQALDLIGRKLPANGGQAFRDLYALIDAFCTAHKGHALAAEIDELKKTLDTLAQLVMTFMKQSLAGDSLYPMLSATPFLAACGDTMLAYLLLEQAVLSDHKRHTAQFFIHQVVPQVRARAKSILSLDRSALDCVL